MEPAVQQPPSDMVRIYARQSPVRVLAPEAAAVIWLQGCARRCAGCILPEAWPDNGGAAYSSTGLAEWVLEQPGINAVVLSGGEPFRQAEGLALMLETIRSRRDFGFVCYTGYRYEELTAETSGGAERLLQCLDLLIDGPYAEAEHADLLWRGSRNQRLLALTDRYAGLLAGLTPTTDRSRGIECVIENDSTFNIVGIPPIPRFRQRLEHSLASKGIRLSTGGTEL